MKQMEQIDEAKNYIAERVHRSAEIGMILGSGLGVMADELEQAVEISYEDIPHFPVSTVAGHEGKLCIGELSGKQVIILKGRFHLYEGYDAETVTFPVRVLKALGVQKIIVTNAAGGINESFNPGDLMLIEDHINWMARNPLVGPNDPDIGVRFPDMSDAYSERLRQIAQQEAKTLEITLQQGVYIGVLGPSYETPAEIRMMRGLGADAVGMSTVPDVIAARHAGLEVLGISCISNFAAGITKQKLSHEEVTETAERVKEHFIGLIRRIIAVI